MAKFIVNEGSGPRTVDLLGTLSVGSNPSCDVILESSTALGCRCELRPLRWGYRVVKVKGELFVNERSVEMADLDHGDTVRVGSVLLLYKQPEGDEFSGSEVTELELLPEADPELEDLPISSFEFADLEVLDESLIVAEPQAPREGDAFQRGRWKRIEALRRLSLARDGQLGDVPPLSEPGALNFAAELDESGAASEWDAFEQSQGLEDKTLRELLLLIDETVAAVPQDEPLAELEELEVLEEIEELEVIDERHAHEAIGMDDAMVRARHKRLEALRRVRMARAGEFESLPGLSADGALDVVRALDQENAVGDIEAFEDSAGLGDATLNQLLCEVRELRDEAEAAAAAAEAAALAAAEAAAAEIAAAELAAAEEAAAAAAAEAAAAEEAAAEAAAAAELESLPELEVLEELGELEELEDLEELDVLEAVPEAAVLEAPATEAPVAPTPVVSGPRPVLSQGVRPVPSGGVRFDRPLPPGRPAPTYLPPVHPGRSPE